MRVGALCFAFCVMATLVGCSTSPEITVRARVAGQVRIVENVPYTEVFKAAVRTVRGEKLRLKVSDSAGGVILATYSPTDASSIFLTVLGSDYKPARGEVVEFVINLEKISDTKTRARLSLQRIQSYNLLGNHEGEEILDFSAYKNFYGKMQTALLAKHPKLEMKSPAQDTQKKKPVVSTPQKT